MGKNRLRRERINSGRLSANDLRKWVEDYVGANRTATYEDCVAAMIDEGMSVPRGGTRGLWDLWDKARQDTNPRRVRD